jgi:cysteine-rich repeat protein
VVSDAYPNGRPDPDVFFERRLVACGDGATDPTEQCDDDNFVDGDGCDSNCTRTGCGNGVRTDGERCDDGNLTAGDGCDANCVLGPTFTPTPTVSPTPTLPPPCAVDCDRDGTVTIDELLLAVNIALGGGETEACATADVNGDGAVTVDEIIRGVNAVLGECA